MTVHPYIKRPRSVVNQPWDVPALAKRYQWPTGLPGGGVIAVVECGGGWLNSDLLRFCHASSVAVPTVIDVPLDLTNAPGKSDADGEVALDIEVAAASYFAATGKAATIRVYWASDIGQGIQKAHRDGCDVCSVSWGDDEAQWGGEALSALGDVTRAAAQGGMITFAAAGDNDSSDGGPGAVNVDAPASARYVIGCGGSSLPQSGQETVWNNNPGNADGEGTGGGYSTFYPSCAWMNGAPVGTGRMVPDLAANADPNTGYNVVIAGQVEVVGGTSAVAPLYAGLFAAFGRKLAPIGPKIWSNHLAFTDITQGNNGKYAARVGPDPCTGLGSPIGTKLAALFVKA
jgi:subtilase family serine protease